MANPPQNADSKPNLDLPLHSDMRWLTGALGRVVRRLEGEEVFQAIESLRTLCRDRRVNKGSLTQVLEQVRQLPIELAAPVARALYSASLATTLCL